MSDIKYKTVAEQQLARGQWFEPTLQAMEAIGGSFVMALAAAYRVADTTNRARIVMTWPEYGADYAEKSRLMAQQAKIG